MKLLAKINSSAVWWPFIIWCIRVPWPAMYFTGPWSGLKFKKSFKIIFSVMAKNVSLRLRFWKILPNNQVNSISVLCKIFILEKVGGLWPQCPPVVLSLYNAFNNIAKARHIIFCRIMSRIYDLTSKFSALLEWGYGVMLPKMLKGAQSLI